MSQILDKVHNVINVAVPYTIIAVASAITSGLLVRSALVARRLRRQPGGESDAVPSTSAEPDCAQKSETGVIRDEENDESFHSSCAAQVLSAAAFLLLCIPAHCHQTAVEATVNGGRQYVIDDGSDVAFVSYDSYTTQRLLLVVWYARHGTIFTVLFTVDVFFRRRCAALFIRLMRMAAARLSPNVCGRWKFACCRRSPPLHYGGKTMVTDRTQTHMVGEPVAV
jgi:hypothetical protein